MEKRHRVFVAINLPEEIKREIFAYSEKWPELPAKWTAKDNLHITLEFLGPITDIEIGEVCLAVKAVAERHNSFPLNMNQVLYGPPKKMPPKMVWAEGEKSKDLAELREDLENALTERVRFVPEKRSFVPHITLARISSFAFKQMEPEEVPEVNEAVDLPFDVNSIEVMESVMRKDGPVYEVIESHELKE